MEGHVCQASSLYRNTECAVATKTSVWRLLNEGSLLEIHKTASILSLELQSSVQVIANRGILK
jgi:hypothetical protein